MSEVNNETVGNLLANVLQIVQQGQYNCKGDQLSAINQQFVSLGHLIEALTLGKIVVTEATEESDDVPSDTDPA